MFLITREEIIVKIIKNKDVLDLGNSWGDLKELIQKNAKSYKGLDIEGKTDFKKDLNKEFDLKEKFDVIIAGELIEHIENTGIFLDNVKRHLKKGGLFFLSTPNPTSFRFSFYALFNKEPEYEGHIKYFTKDALILILKKYFKLKKVSFCNLTTNIENKNLIWKIKFNIENFIGMIISRYSPNLYAVCKNE